ncbi:MAG: calcium/sodium antiporter [Balneolaceae bacterium]
MILTISLFIAGLLLLVFGADFLVRSASSIAEALGIPKLIVGLTVIAFGTSAPELAISLQSAYAGSHGILVGNVVGSNIANILLILGISAVILPVKVKSDIIRIDVPVMIFCGLLMLGLSYNGIISFFDAILLLVVLILYLFFLAREARYSMIHSQKKKKKIKPFTEAFLLILGLIMLIYGANLMVDSAVSMAGFFGISDLVIGLTIVAVGTSLPEIAAAVAAILRREPDLVVGNILGSNILNIVAVIGITGLFFPASIIIEEQSLFFDIPVMLVVFVACLPIFFSGFKISRWEGFYFLACYFTYMLFLYFYTTGAATLSYFEDAMIYFALPLTFITLFVISYRQWKKIDS